MINLRTGVLLAALCFASALSSAQDSPPFSFNLPGHGKILLAVPATWNAEVHPGVGQAAPTLELSQKNGPTFHVLLTPMWTASTDTPFPDDASVQGKVATVAKQVEVQSVEQTLQVRDLFGKANRGYYFTATDRAPKPGEWKYLTQGIIRVGSIDLAFSALTNDGQGEVVKSALAMLLAASHVPI
jgi:hypothetical protein